MFAHSSLVLCDSVLIALCSTWIGIILFLVDAVLIAWVKFAPLETGKKRITGLVVGEPLIRPAGSGNTSSRSECIAVYCTATNTEGVELVPFLEGCTVAYI